MTGAADELGERVRRVRGRIRQACAAAGRDPAGVRLVGVTKTHPPELARAAVRLGIDELGENRVSELIAKQPRVEGARWHFIGRVQSRKARDVVGRVALIHSVDRRSLIDELAKRAARPQDVLIQVNVGEDPAKGGCRADEVPELVAYAQRQPELVVRGLMTMPPLPPDGADPGEHARGSFARLRELRDELRDRWPAVTELSMGMSADLEAAIAEGATIVRVGRALFGERGPRPWEPVAGVTDR